jgi:hypothetical protein
VVFGRVAARGRGSRAAESRAWAGTKRSRRTRALWYIWDPSWDGACDAQGLMCANLCDMLWIRTPQGVAPRKSSRTSRSSVGLPRVSLRLLTYTSLHDCTCRPASRFHSFILLGPETHSPNTAATVRQRDPDGPTRETAPPRRCPRKHAAAHICNRDRGPVPDPVNSLLWGSAEELLPHEHQRLSK